MKRYLVIGVSVYIFELLVIVVAQRLGANSVAAVGIAFWLGLTASFGLQKIVTFGDMRLHHRVLLPQILAFSLLVLFNFGFTLLFTAALDGTLPAVWCRTLALGITTIWNFYLYKTRIFNVKHKPKKRAAKRKNVTIVKRYRAWQRQPRVKRLHKFASQPKVGKWYLGLSLLILFATTLLWATLGAHLQQANADQLINTRLFSSQHTLQGAFFPDQHSFLIKWPLFYLVKLLSYTPAAFLFVTVLTVVITLSIFVYLLSRIERRPLVLGSLCLALASVLLLVPAQPYAGALLPVNMAMLATRNLEYMFYILGLVCLVRAPHIKSRQFIGSVILLSLLIASDKLFLPIGLLGAFLAMFCYAIFKRRDLTTLGVRWFAAVAASGIAAAGALALINHARLTHIVGSQAGPYGFVQSVKSLILGAIFAVSGLLTNFGANPAYDAVTLRQIPQKLLDHLISPAGPAYVVNFIIFLLCLYVTVLFLVTTLRKVKPKAARSTPVQKLSVLLVWSAAATICLFIVSNHYHQVDARYLTLCLFALFIVLAGWFRPRRIDPELVALCVPLLLIGIICGTIGSVRTYNSQKQALSDIKHRNEVIAQTLANHHTSVLVGDYWRVLPVQSLSAQQQQKILPLESCSQPREVLSSEAWRPDLHRTSFAYLLSLDKSQTDYPACSLAQITAIYGIPNSSALIDGSLAQPKELLLFYDRGIHFPRTLSTSLGASRGVLPIALSDLPHTTCGLEPTTMNITAHEDDDLLFMNPDLQHALDAKHCVRSIYLTAGDAGGAQPYWLSRELGSEAAYSEMIGSKGVWMHRTVRLPGGQFITEANIRGNNQASLIFMHLPDGNLDGRGFGASHHESLAELETGRIDKLETVDGQSSYSADQLTAAIAELIQIYQPAEIHTQSDLAGGQYKDHSDHRAAGRFAGRAYSQHVAQPPSKPVSLSFYMGYPIHELQPNVSGQDLSRKEAAFDAYAAFDKGVCRGNCQQNPVYNIYLARQYQNTY